MTSGPWNEDPFGAAVDHAEHVFFPPVMTSFAALNWKSPENGPLLRTKLFRIATEVFPVTGFGLKNTSGFANADAESATTIIRERSFVFIVQPSVGVSQLNFFTRPSGPKMMTPVRIAVGLKLKGIMALPDFAEVQDVDLLTVIRAGRKIWMCCMPAHSQRGGNATAWSKGSRSR